MIPEKRHLGDETYSIINRRKKMKEELEDLKSPMTKKRFSYWRLVQSLCSISREKCSEVFNARLVIFYCSPPIDRRPGS